MNEAPRNDGVSAAPGEPPKKLSRGLFVTAFLIGISGAFLGTCPGGIARMLLEEAGVSSDFAGYSSFAVPCFLGGFFSGWVLEYGIRGRQFRLLYLLAASPAMPIWFGSLVAAAAGFDVRPRHVLFVGVLCAFAAGGSLVGCLVSQWNLSKKPPVGDLSNREGGSSFRLNPRIGPPTGMFVFGTLAGWAPFMACGMFILIITGIDDLVLNTPSLLALCVGGFVGGFISGWLIEPGLPEHRWKMLWLIAASPAFLTWALALGAMVFGQKISTVGATAVAGICAAAVAGSYIGCTLGRRYRLSAERKMRNRGRPVTGDDGAGRFTDDGDEKSAAGSEKGSGKG